MPNSLATNQDCQMVVDGAKLCRAFANTDSMKRLIDAPFHADVSQMSDDMMLDDFRKRSGTVFHPVGDMPDGGRCKNRCC
jgi:choline dehydrogenase